MTLYGIIKTDKKNSIFGHLCFTDVYVHVQVVMQLIINAGGLKIF